MTIKNEIKYTIGLPFMMLITLISIGCVIVGDYDAIGELFVDYFKWVGCLWGTVGKEGY
jgi:hypothetical protein